MKQLKLFAILSVGILFFCNSCKKDTVTTDSLYVPAMMDVTAGATLAELQQGRILFENSCGACHGLYSPDTYSASNWKSILSIMAPRAGLSQTNTNLVIKYVCRGKQ